MLAALLTIALLVAGERTVNLENGARVVLLAAPGTERIAAKSLYPIGFVHEPEGMTQAAHLIEHLVCMGGTPGVAEGAWWDELSALGIVNAETMPDFTHYDYEAPASALERVFRAEAARLAGLRITRELVERESPRIYAETDAVERAPGRPLFKHVLMGANQAWRYGSATALVRGGLETLDLDAVRALHRGAYVPAALTFVVAGDFDLDKAETLARETIGAVEPRPGAPTPPIDWTRAPARARLAWDARASFVIVAWPPPREPLERLALSLAGESMLQLLNGDEALGAHAGRVLGSNPIWPVGELPFFFCASVAPGADAERAADVLLERATAAAHLGEAEVARLRQHAAMFGAGVGSHSPSATARTLERMGHPPDRAMGLALLHICLQRAAREHQARGIDRARLGELGRLDFGALVRSAVAPDGAKVLIVEPATPEP